MRYVVIWMNLKKNVLSKNLTQKNIYCSVTLYDFLGQAKINLCCCFPPKIPYFLGVEIRDPQMFKEITVGYVTLRQLVRSFLNETTLGFFRKLCEGIADIIYVHPMGSFP